ncbi:Uncharacterised protein [Serratia proteamaculans]|uniref:hypothetical protein n=1 Tax=Serratia proteamaculans TaxID=28151 RepID=UPI00217BAFCC|nr:hypothetical protein [Serratia proteamaculans]CAI0723872.1 Uncharacterised protein [Serratia proteamaculans]CAI1520042.1 Uncharacterised protein [Serratia proteamaculans]
MDNKLSELKDVADYWRKVKSGELPAPGPNEIGITIWTAEAAIKRITELERANKAQDDHINQQQDRIDSLEKTNSGLGRGLAAAEKRLATPVRLPELCGDGENDNEYTEGLNDGINQSAKAIRAAGFTFTVGNE